MSILDKSIRNKIFLEVLEDYNGVHVRNLQRMDQKLENAFCQTFHFFKIL